MNKIAIIGGSGFLGYYLTDELLQRNKEVLIFDIKPPKQAANVTFVNVSNFSISELEHHFSKVDGVIDLAYTSNPKTSFDDPIVDIMENLPMTVKLLVVANKLNNIKRFVFVSSGGTVYGDVDTEIIHEEHKTTPISPYGITKLAIEKYGLMYFHTNDFPFVIARPSNAYGIGQRINTGQGFIITAIDSIVNEREITIFGKEGTIRDYIYVTDIACGLADLIESSKSGEAYNIGTGVGKSNLDIVELLTPLAKGLGKEVHINNVPPRKFDVTHNVLDKNKIKMLSNWEPKVDIALGLKKTWDWYLKTYNT